MGSSTARGTVLWPFLLITLATAVTAQPAGISPPPAPHTFSGSRFSFRVGLSMNAHDTRARVDSELLGRGTMVDMERELGLDSSTRDLRVDMAFRLGRRHQIQAGYLSLSRKWAASIRSAIQWGDFVFPVDVGVASSIDARLIPVGYRYSVILSDRLDVGVTAGVFAMFLDAGVSAPEVDVVERESAEFPLPVVGGDGVFTIVSGLFLTGGMKYFAVQVEDVQGSWREFRGAIEFAPLRRVGLGAGYRSIRFEADGSEGLFTRPEGTLLFLDYRFSGPHVYVTIAL